MSDRFQPGSPTIEIREQSPDFLATYARIPMSFAVTHRFEITSGRQGPQLAPEPRAVSPVWRKDYDAQPGCHPLGWADRFDLTKWGVLSAHAGGRHVGGAVIAHGTDGAEMLDGRTDLAVIWDLRVAPGHRRRGVARELVTAAERWARNRGCRQMLVETQDINVPACRLYAACGFTVAGIDQSAYPEFPAEAQVLWRKDLAPVSDRRP